MTRSKRLTDTGVSTLKPRAARFVSPDPELPGHYIRVQPNGAKSYVAVARDPSGKQVWSTIGSVALFGIEEAREKARAIIVATRAGAARADPESFQSVAAEWFKRHAEAKGLRSRHENKRYLDKWILPELGGREFTSIRRADVAKLLDHIEDNAGPVAADNALGVIRTVANWYSTRNEGYASPVVKGMRRTSTKERARQRILSDDEIRAVWKQAEANGTFGALIRVLLLTGQRRDKVASMRWQDVRIDGTWMIPAEAREKGNAGELMLHEMALAIIKAQPQFANNPHVFAGRGGSYLTGYSKSKRAFDAKVAQLGEVAPWTLHDLRRTARSLMARANVRPDIAERVLGHAIPGVGGTYDRHTYTQQKTEALKRLAALLQNILNPPSAPYLFYLDTKVRGK